MGGMVTFGLAVLLTLSYRIVERLLGRIAGSTDTPSMKSLGIYIWGLCAVAAALIMQDDYVFRFPVVDTTVFALAAIVMLANTVLSQFSGYQPTGRMDIIHFVVAYPIVEEILFRGLLLPLLNPAFGFMAFELMYMPVTWSVLMTALLFAVAHLQYYRLSRTSVKYMSFALIGGMLFGVIANSTQSILIPVLLHVEYNLLAYYYSSRMRSE